MRRIIFLFLILSWDSSAQETVSYAGIDSASYVEYMNNNFKKLKKTGKKALKENVDFYLLRMRLGIAGYTEKNFAYALPHFEEAFAMNPADTIVQEYLYYTYLYSGRIENASSLATKLSVSIQEKVGFKSKRVDNFSLGFGGYLNKNIADYESRDIITPNFQRGESTLNGSAFEFNSMLQTTKKNRTHFYHKITLFQTNSLSIEQFKFPQQKQTKDYSNLQFQYNFGVSHHTQKGYLMSAGLAYFRTNTSDLIAQPQQQQPLMGMKIVFSDLQTTYNNFYASFTFGKQMKYIFPTLATSFSNLYGLKQFQNELSMAYYPFGNMNLYGKTSFAILSNDGSFQKVLSQKVGVKCARWLWLEGKYSIGNHSNYISNSGFLSYNTADQIKLNAGIDVHIYSKKMEFIFGYNYQIRQGNYGQYTSQTSKSTTFYNYINNNLTTTIKWNF